MKKLLCILAILSFASVSWSADKKGVSATKGIQKAEIEEKEIIVKTVEQKAKRVMTKVDDARVKRLKR